METPLDQTTPPPRPASQLGKVALINFAVLLLYMTLSGFSKGDAAMQALFIDAMLLVVQVGLNLVVGLILLFTPAREYGKAMMLSGILVGIIGFGACLGKQTLLGS